MARKPIAPKIPELIPAAAYIANESFYDGRLGLTVVVGQTIGAGHPLLEGKPGTMFRPFVPTWPSPDADEAAADAQAAAEAQAAAAQAAADAAAAEAQAAAEAKAVADQAAADAQAQAEADAKAAADAEEAAKTAADEATKS